MKTDMKEIFCRYRYLLFFTGFYIPVFYIDEVLRKGWHCGCKRESCRTPKTFLKMRQEHTKSSSSLRTTVLLACLLVVFVLYLALLVFVFWSFGVHVLVLVLVIGVALSLWCCTESCPLSALVLDGVFSFLSYFGCSMLSCVIARRQDKTNRGGTRQDRSRQWKTKTRERQHTTI